VTPRRYAAQNGERFRSQGALTGDVITHRISIEDGAILKGSVQVRAADPKTDKSQQAEARQAEAAKPGSPSLQ
jgi:cytoskeletal protein CcmA (bactofilin family)